MIRTRWWTAGISVALLLVSAPSAYSQTIRAQGLRAPVELLRDSAGIVHIRAQNEHDLFFAQGYSAARDRLFQLELWRRQATGTMAEVLGAQWVERDRASRLLKFRGSMRAELAHYHPRGATIITAFVDGINAYIAETRRDPSLLPPELVWLGITPQRWTPAVVISRHNALASNARDEMGIARAVRAIGDDAVKRRRAFTPSPARLSLDSSIVGLLDAASDNAAMADYDGFKNAPRFRATDVLASVRRASDSTGTRDSSSTADAVDRWESNNWVLDGGRTASGKPIVANDPHRTITTPSLRYMVHLTAPGWDVIGGGEPAIPGVAIGHNRVAAWGLTIFGIDAEDLYVYETAQRNPRAYRYGGGTETMREVIDTIVVKGASPRIVRLRFTRHGPVLYQDSARGVAMALRAGWLEVGGAPYLASLRIDQATSWEAFRRALSFAHMPTLNWIWGDTSGVIGWQTAGIAPVRKTWDGLVPVPGDGRFEWSGYLPIMQLPHLRAPADGAFGTANAFNVPADYPHMNAVARTWAEPFRLLRLREVLDTLRNATIAQMGRLQHDETALAARALVPLLRTIPMTTPLAQAAKDSLLAWNGVLARSSVGAAIYALWERRLSTHVADMTLPPEARGVMRTVPLTRTIEWLTTADTILGENPQTARDFVVARAFNEAVQDLSRRFGREISAWAYGSEKLHYARIAHPLDGVVNDSLRAWLSPGPMPRGGYANTLNATGNTDNQTAGASFRVVMDLANWDQAIVTNTPGQSGDPRSPHYRDLFARWASGEYVALPYSRAAVERAVQSRLTLRP
ncbi:MAG: penicillin acylase family protein [Gemmatimonadaceae bacterium]|nr:penicillin acylase family protein [Gemmatimonadaceae bacterium]